MKTFALFLSLMLFSSGAFAKSCRNFAGTFEMITNGSPARFIATQDKCKTLSIVYDFYTSGQKFEKLYFLDGVKRKTFEDKELIAYEAAQTVGDEIQASVEDYMKATKTTRTALVYFRLDEKKDLRIQSDYLNEHGSVYSSKTVQFRRLP